MDFNSPLGQLALSSSGGGDSCTGNCTSDCPWDPCGIIWVSVSSGVVGLAILIVLCYCMCSRSTESCEESCRRGNCCRCCCEVKHISSAPDHVISSTKNPLNTTTINL